MTLVEMATHGLVDGCAMARCTTSARWTAEQSIVGYPDVLGRGWSGELCEPQDIRVERDDLVGSAGKGSPVVDGGPEVPS